MSVMLARSLLRAQGSNVTRRLFTTSGVLRQEEVSATPNLGHVPPPKKPVGAFRGGCVQTDRYEGMSGKFEHADSAAAS